MDGGNGLSLLAQASSAQAIGRIDTLSGSGTITRVDGSVVPADKGAAVYQGDVVETAKGGRVGIVFVDSTTFALGESGQMRMDELVYNPQTKAGNLGLSMLKGAFVLVTGEIAPSSTDAMTIRTPVGTIGIRGTKVGGAVDAENGLILSLLPDPVGRPAAVVVSNAAGTQFITETNTGLQISSYDTAPTSPQPLNSLPPALNDVLAQVLAFIDGIVGDQIIQAIQQVAEAQSLDREAAVRDVTVRADDAQTQAQQGTAVDGSTKIVLTDFETKLSELLDQQGGLPSVTPFYVAPIPTSHLAPVENKTPQFSPTITPVVVKPEPEPQPEPEPEPPNETVPPATPTLTGSHLVGSDLAELLIGTSGDDLIYGNGGNDTILAISGYDSLYGGAGDDIIQAVQPAYVYDSKASAIPTPSKSLSIDGGAGYDIATIKLLADVDLSGGNEAGPTGRLDAHISNIEKLYVDISALDTGTLYLSDSIAGASKLGQINLIGSKVAHVEINAWGDHEGININAAALGGSNEIVGSYFSDTIIAGAGNDTIRADDGWNEGESEGDSLNGGAGNDVISGSTGHDTIQGGTGNDTIYGNGGSDILNGGAGDDVIYLSEDSGNAVVSGGAGNDRIEVSWESGEGSPLSNNAIHGGAGVDTLALQNGNGYEGYIGPGFDVTGIDVLEIGPKGSGAADFAFDFTGTNFASADQNGDGKTGDLRIAVKGDLGYLHVDGTTGGEGSIIDAHNYDVEQLKLTAGSGNDTLILSGVGTGGATITGGAGDDVLLLGANAANAVISGGSGNDTLIVDGGMTLTGTHLGTEAGSADVVRVVMNDQAISSFGLGSSSTGIDRLEVYVNVDNVGSASVLIQNGVVASGATLTIQGYGHDGLVDFYQEGASAGMGGVKSSISDLTDISAGVSINALGNAGNISVAGGFAGNDMIIGGMGNDTIYAGNGNDIVSGGGGIDSLYGGLGDDSLVLALGGGRLDGGAGNDTLIAGSSGMVGNVSIYGGDGNDSITGGSHAVLIEGGSGNDTISLRSSAVVYAGDGNDTVTASSAGAPNIDLGDGDDYLAISSGVTAFTVTGGTGNDTINVSSLSSAPGLIYAGEGNDSVRAGLGNDTIYTGSGNDLVSGNDGNDKIYVQGTGTIFGGEGNDTINFSDATSGGSIMISGGNGADSFEGSTTANVTFRYFEPMEGTDVFAPGAFNAATMQIEVSELDFPGYGTVIELSGTAWNDALMADGSGALVLFTNTTTNTKQLYADYNGNGGGYSYLVVDFGTNAVTKDDIQFTDYS
ncbi:FecR domain-containing protein [Lacibacterium aquatile]|uniref:FecR domain-containing protein n=1 Tax=Lacibacterium aquatile TaxID=1168082 RepID=A0ABW5DUK1_9PROT